MRLKMAWKQLMKLMKNLTQMICMKTLKRRRMIIKKTKIKIEKIMKLKMMQIMNNHLTIKKMMKKK